MGEARIFYRLLGKELINTRLLRLHKAPPKGIIRAC